MPRPTIPAGQHGAQRPNPVPGQARSVRVRSPILARTVPSSYTPPSYALGGLGPNIWYAPARFNPTPCRLGLAEGIGQTSAPSPRRRAAFRSPTPPVALARTDCGPPTALSRPIRPWRRLKPRPAPRPTRAPRTPATRPASLPCGTSLTGTASATRRSLTGTPRIVKRGPGSAPSLPLQQIRWRPRRRLHRRLGRQALANAPFPPACDASRVAPDFPNFPETSPIPGVPWPIRPQRGLRGVRNPRTDTDFG